jgi:hypothetical protein
MSHFDAKGHARSLAASGPGRTAGADFLPRAALCHLVAACGPEMFSKVPVEVVWPGSLKDFRNDLGRDEHLAAAQALIALAQAPAKAA